MSGVIASKSHCRKIAVSICEKVLVKGKPAGSQETCLVDETAFLGERDGGIKVVPFSAIFWHDVLFTALPYLRIGKRFCVPKEKWTWNIGKKRKRRSFC